VDDPRIDISPELTQLGYERTQLSLIRTVLVLITDGFGIGKGTETLHEACIATGEALVKDGCFSGILLTISGTVNIVPATGNSFRRMKELDQMHGNQRKFPYPSFILSCVICFFGAIVIYFSSKVWNFDSENTLKI
jgi:uncharacterized membrane protein YidH (DUF202 family)